MEEKLLEKICNYLDEVGNQDLYAIDIDTLFKIVDIYKDLKEVQNMNNYGEYNDYGRRGYDTKYRGDSYMEGMRGSYRNYEEARNEYNRGNYGAKEDGLKELEYMMHAAIKFIKMIKEEATSPEEQEIVRKHIAKLSV